MTLERLASRQDGWPWGDTGPHREQKKGTEARIWESRRSAARLLWPPCGPTAPAQSLTELAEWNQRKHQPLASPPLRCSLQVSTCPVAPTSPCLEKESGKLTFPPASPPTTEKYLKKFPSITGRAGRGQVCTELAAVCWEMKEKVLLICFAFSRRGRGRQGPWGSHEAKSSLILLVIAWESVPPNCGLDPPLQQFC